MSIPISREAFDSANQHTKLLLIYDMLADQNQLLITHSDQQKLMCERRCSNCDQRFIKIERRRVLNTTLATLGGVLGGFVAVILKLKLLDE